MEYAKYAGATFAVALLSATPLAAGQDGNDTAQEESATVEEDFGYVGDFYPAEGAELTYQYCVACHSEMLVVQQGQTREGWNDLLEWMVEEQGMDPIPEEDREIVLDYLATHYNTDRPHFPQ